LNNLSKNRGSLNEIILCQSDMEGATTMSNKELMKRLYYFSTFDGGLYLVASSTNASFIMNMKKENLDYVQRVESALVDAGIGCVINDRKLQDDGFNRQPQVTLRSKNHPKLTTIRDRIYIDGRKVIDPHMLTMMDAEALAIIYMADGSCVYDKRSPEARPNITLNTKGFSYGDNWLLKKAIKDTLDLEFNINRQNNYWYLRLRAKDMDKFFEVVKDFVLPSFNYKLGR
jgi:LAGLIDADG DNA endonuclease family